MRLVDACALQEEYKTRHSGKRLLLIDVAPTVDAVPVRHGQWIRIGVPDIDGNQQYRCSVCECGELHTPSVKVSYCWNCGARMDGK